MFHICGPIHIHVMITAKTSNRAEAEAMSDPSAPFKTSLRNPKTNYTYNSTTFIVSADVATYTDHSQDRKQS